ncbi:MAG: hypothetical protein QNJ45_28040 [Ardenticatenaceae bacterium]|nr:hypothetical protein [Ardenticatenaceae bacterium]
MGIARLNVWVRDKDHPCKPDMRWVWSVDVFVCDGRPLYWCGTRYYGAHRTIHGHAEIKVPPGCYIVRARTGSSGHHNLFTHATMVVVGCDETACVNLVPPGAWTCGQQWNMALQFQAAIDHVPQELAERAIEANKAVLDHLPKDMFPAEDREALENMMKQPMADEKGPDVEGDP